MTRSHPSSAANAAVLSVNAGSSSLKFAIYPCHGDQVDAAGLSGLAEGLEPGGRPVLTVTAPGQAPQQRALTVPADGASPFDVALRAVVETVAAQGTPLVAVAHRIVHGGDRFSASIWLDDEALAYLATLAPLAPLHQPHNLAGVAALRRVCPDLPQVGCFDTAFHATIGEAERRFALPESLAEQGVRRYGFHGLSYAYVTAQLLGRSRRAHGRLLLAHLGNGASLCAVQAGRSVATTMGFSALDGLMMGSRSGALDPGVVLHLWRQGWTEAQVEQLLYKESGLLGVSGLSADMRLLRHAAADGNAPAQHAIDLFTYRLRREAGALAAVLGGLDVLVCTGGIGEHDAATRAALAEALGFLGVRLDAAANAAARGDAIAAIHAAGSDVEVWVIPTDEGRVAAQAAWALLDAEEAPDNPGDSAA